MKFLQTEDGQLLADQLLRIRAVEVRDFALGLPGQTSSPAVETNFRTKNHPKPGPLDRWALKWIAQGLIEYLDEVNLQFDAVCSMPREGESLMEGLLHSRPMQSLSLAAEDESELPSRVTSIRHFGLQPGSRVLLLDDVVSDAGTKLEVVRLLRSQGFKVNDVLVVVDRQQGASEQLSANGVRLHSLFQAHDLVEHVRRKTDPSLPAL